MTSMDQPPEAGAREKIDEDDHDLLTFGEVAERLRLEVAAAEAEVERVRREAVTVDELDKAENRLNALRSAAARNTAQPINDANFEKFFGYPGKAKRNLPPAR